MFTKMEMLFLGKILFYKVVNGSPLNLCLNFRHVFHTSIFLWLNSKTIFCVVSGHLPETPPNHKQVGQVMSDIGSHALDTIQM